MAHWDFNLSDDGVRHQTVATLLRKIRPLFRPHKRYLITGMLLLLIVTASQLIGPLILQYIIDDVLPAGNLRGLWLAAGVYVLIAAGGAGVGYLQAIALFNMGIRIITELKARLFEHVLKLGLDFHTEQSPGRLISRVESDTETLKELFGEVSVNLLRNLLLFVGILAVLLIKQHTLAAYLLILLPVMFGAAFWFMSYMRQFWRAWRSQHAAVMAYVTEYVQGVEVIQQYNYTERARQRMHAVNLAKFRVEVPAFYRDYGFWAAFMLGEVVAIIIILVAGVQGIIAGTLTLGVLVMFIEYVRQMFFPIQQLSEQLNFVQRSLISVERVFGILETEPSINDGTAPAGELRFEREIRFEGVWFAYEQENWILRDATFTLRKGEKVALVGASGGGKSTLVNLLLRFYDPQRGRITVDGRDIRDFAAADWRALIGLVLQDIYLFPGSVADNLRVFESSIPLEQITRVAEVAHADRVIGRLPGGYDGELAERGANLSVGERQLISFARALAFDPPILVLDEATSSVDPATERMVQEALDRLLAGRTALIVAHRLSTILNADQIIVVHGGELVERGQHAELLAQGGLYAKLFRLQFPDSVGPALLPASLTGAAALPTYNVRPPGTADTPGDQAEEAGKSAGTTVVRP